MRYALALLFVLGYSVCAHAHDHSRPELNGWYQSLHAGDKAPCCDGEEANHIADMDWDTQCEQNNSGEQRCHYRVFIYNKWWDVPARAVVDGPNRDGAPLVWAAPTYNNKEVFSVFIRCFLPGAGG